MKTQSNHIKYPFPVDVEGITVKYGSKTVLDNVSFRAYEGSVNVVIGGSGCGKSTLLRHALGLSVPASGIVRLLGVQLSEAKEEQIRAIRGRIGVLFQSGALFSSMSVGENIAIAVRENTDLPEPLVTELVRMKLALVGLDDAVNKYPEQLSGGMKKRAALARAIASDPAVLFCDEPSAGLDPVVASELDDLLISLNERFKMTMVVVTHDIESIKKIAHRVVMLDGGKVAAEGSLEEVLQHNDKRVQDFFNRVSHADEKAKASLLAASQGAVR
mgnify:CR=1 FL=1